MKAQPTAAAKNLARHGVANATASGFGGPPHVIGSRGGGRSTGRNSAVRPRPEANLTPAPAFNIQTNHLPHPGPPCISHEHPSAINLANVNSHSNKNINPMNKSLLAQPSHNQAAALGASVLASQDRKQTANQKKNRKYFKMD